MKKKRYPLNGNGFKLKRAEIIDLSQCYSDMHSIDVRKLMEMTEEEIIAKGKLDIIYAQINPHFLYNTLDAVSALALMKENEKCFEITQALGNFYRNSFILLNF